MKYLDEFRDPALCRSILREIHRVRLDGHVTIMEVCGTHTMAVARYGIRRLLPDFVRLVSGPGCPVCVTPNRYIDYACTLARNRDVIVATFGDMLRVPGSRSSLEREQARGADIRIVFSPLEALSFAVNEPRRHVVFLGVGFETTAPTIASLIVQAAEYAAENLSVLAAPKTMPPPMRALAGDPDVGVDAFLCPAHVSAIIGTKLYEGIVHDFGIPCVVAGFEPVDILRSVHLLLERLRDKSPGVDIEYSRVVRPEGNIRARAVVDTVFEPADAEWRGLGVIPDSGLAIRSAFRQFDAAARFPIDVPPPTEHAGCMCGDILRAVASPADCPLFGTACTPHSPVGPCMVSTEGTCAAAYAYERHTQST